MARQQILPNRWKQRTYILVQCLYFKNPFNPFEQLLTKQIGSPLRVRFLIEFLIRYHTDSLPFKKRKIEKGFFVVTTR